MVMNSARLEAEVARVAGADFTWYFGGQAQPQLPHAAFGLLRSDLL